MKRDAAGRPYATKTVQVYKKAKLTPANQAAVTQEVKRQLAAQGDFKQLQGRDLAATGIINTGYMLDLGTSFARGDNAINNFEGEKVFPKSLRIRLQWTANDVHNLMRCIVVQWFGPGTPAVTDILNTAGVAATQQMLCYRQWSRHKQYKILHDSMMQLDNVVGLCGQNGPQNFLDIYISGKRIRPIEFNVNTTDYQKGGLFMLTLSDSLAVPHPDQNAVWEMIFTD